MPKKTTAARSPRGARAATRSRSPRSGATSQPETSEREQLIATLAELLEGVPSAALLADVRFTLVDATVQDVARRIVDRDLVAITPAFARRLVETLRRGR